MKLETPLTIAPTATLNNGVVLPRLGLGVFRSAPGGEAKAAVKIALELGYRHIDTARVYKNEVDVGQAIVESGVARDDIFVTTKLWNGDQGFETTKRALAQSLKSLGLAHVDLYLVHWPVEDKRNESWRALVDLHKDGLARAIGVSNFIPRHLDELMAKTGVVPHVNQIEMSPFNQQRETLAWCAARGVVVEAYSPLTKGTRLTHPVVVKTAKRLGRTPAQVMLRWCLEQGAVVLPKSVRRERIAENAAIFDFALDDAGRAELSALDEGLYTGWNPTNQR